jgi:hypothetical protein
MTDANSNFMSVKTDLVKEFLVAQIQGAVEERQSRQLPVEIEAALSNVSRRGLGAGVDVRLAVALARAGYITRAVETVMFEPARAPSTEIAELLTEANGTGDATQLASTISTSLATSEPIERPSPDDDRAMTWRIPGPGGHVRHYVAIAAIDSLAGGAAMDHGRARDPAALKRCWLYGFFLRSCEEVLAQT